MEWTGARYADKPTVEVRTWIDAPPARVWALVSDIELMPRTSTELQSVEWLDGVTGPCVGARFVGHSKHEALGEWSTTSYIVEYRNRQQAAGGVEQQREDVPRDAVLAPEARLHGVGGQDDWAEEAVDGGTELSQRAQLGPARSGLSRAIDQMPDKEQKIVFVRLREFEAGMTSNLEHIKRLAES